jgi:hypothetical protein
MTPPFNMRARPVLTVKLDSPEAFWEVEVEVEVEVASPLVVRVGSSVAILELE